MNEDYVPSGKHVVEYGDDERFVGSENRGASLLLQNELHTAWKYATRAVNVCESIGLPDTQSAVADIVVRISQQLEFVETQLQSEQIAARRASREEVP